MNSANSSGSDTALASRMARPRLPIALLGTNGQFIYDSWRKMAADGSCEMAKTLKTTAMAITATNMEQVSAEEQVDGFSEDAFKHLTVKR